MFKVNNTIIKTADVVIVNFEQISYIVLVFMLLTLNQ